LLPKEVEAASLDKKERLLQKKMKTETGMNLCLVCHTETDWWNGGFRSIDLILPKFMQMTTSVHDSQGASPRVAWCLTPQVVEHRPDPFQKLLNLGHETGIHSHFPGGNGDWEHDQKLNSQNLDEFHVWFPKIYAQMVQVGFPPPRVHATWMFAYREPMTRILAEAGIRVDCSVCYGGAHYLPNGFLLADSRNRRSGKPYRLAESDHCVEGTSRIVELPVSGGFGSYWEPNEKGGFEYFKPVESDAEMIRQLDLFQKRLAALPAGEVDVFHIHFHLYEFLMPDGTSDEKLVRARRLLELMVRNPRVIFSTTSEAIENWSNNK
jgi:hypothetical protein